MNINSHIFRSIKVQNHTSKLISCLKQLSTPWGIFSGSVVVANIKTGNPDIIQSCLRSPMQSCRIVAMGGSVLLNLSAVAKNYSYVPLLAFPGLQSLVISCQGFDVPQQEDTRGALSSFFESCPYGRFGFDVRLANNIIAIDLISWKHN